MIPRLYYLAMKASYFVICETFIVYSGNTELRMINSGDDI